MNAWVVTLVVTVLVCAMLAWQILAWQEKKQLKNFEAILRVLFREVQELPDGCYKPQLIAPPEGGIYYYLVDIPTVDCLKTVILKHKGKLSYSIKVENGKVVQTGLLG